LEVLSIPQILQILHTRAKSSKTITMPAKKRALSNATNTQPPAKAQKQAAGESVDSRKQDAVPESSTAASSGKENGGKDQGDVEVVSPWQESLCPALTELKA
jgi:hypothetical protein